MIWFVFVLLLKVLLATQQQSSSQWIDSQNISQWYNPFDLCMIYNASSDSVDNIMKSCETTMPSNKLPPIRCRAGNTWPSKSGFCSSVDIPFNQRKNLQRSVIGFDNPLNNPLSSFFRKLSAQNGALLLVGDSVMQQFFSAIACELEREGVWSDPSRFTNTDQPQHVRVKDQRNANGGAPAPIKFLPIYHFVNGRFDRIANASMHHLKTTVEAMAEKVSTLVVVLNMGLHYIDNPEKSFARADYQAQMTMALRYLHGFAARQPAKNIQIFWRETTAQHFPTPNGYWPGVRYSNDMKLGCVPIKDPSPAADWRNRDIDDIVHRHSLSKIRILRFYNLTVPLWSEHPNGHMKDCTHFCWTPMLYQPLFHELDRALQ